MPGSSVSTCHLCHLHSHNHDNLVRTSPLRHSRGRTKSSSKYRHHHGHSNGGYNSSREDGGKPLRSNSASALARLTDHSHSLPGSRSNSLSRYHREVSVMPDGGDTYGRSIRPSTSTRSLDLNPPISLLENRTTTLPRVSTPLHSQTQIHVQPDILVNAMPRSRTNSRSGSLPRNPGALSQDNSHDYYMDIHRQRFKEEKRKHRFNLQTVMLIGCYTLLVMIAIVVGVVLCYQNGWLGLGPSQGKIGGDKTHINNSNSVQRDSIDMKNRRNPSHKTANIANSNVRTRLRNTENGNVNINPSLDHNEHFNSAGLFPAHVHHQIPHRSEDDLSNQRNHPRHISNQNTNRNRVQSSSSVEGVNNQRNIPNVRQSTNPVQLSSPVGAINNQRNIPNSRQSTNPVQLSSPIRAISKQRNIPNVRQSTNPVQLSSPIGAINNQRNIPNARQSTNPVQLSSPIGAISNQRNIPNVRQSTNTVQLSSPIGAINNQRNIPNARQGTNPLQLNSPIGAINNQRNNQGVRQNNSPVQLSSPIRPINNQRNIPIVKHGTIPVQLSSPTGVINNQRNTPNVRQNNNPVQLISPTGQLNNQRSNPNVRHNNNPVQLITGQINNQRNNLNVRQNNNPVQLSSPTGLINNQRNNPNVRQNNNPVQLSSPTGLINNQRNNPNVSQRNIPHKSVNNPPRPTLVSQNPQLNQRIFTNQSPDPRLRQNIAGGFVDSSLTRSGTQPLKPTISNSASITRENINPNVPSIFRPGILLNTSPSLNINDGVTNIHNPNGNRNSQAAPFSNNSPIRQGNLDSNTIAKTLFQGNFPSTQVNRPNSNVPTSNANLHILNENNSNSNKNPSVSDKILSGDTDSLTTQELLDLLAIRRMRDLLNSEGNAKNLLELLRNVAPSEDTRLELIREEKLTAPDFKDQPEESQNPRRGSGRNIKGTITANPNTFQIHELIQALNDRTTAEAILNRANLNPSETIHRRRLGVDNKETNPTNTEGREASSTNIDSHLSSSLNGLINRTVNGAIIRLLNSKTSDLKQGNIDPRLSFNVSGVSVFPVNSEDLRILLESNPANVKDSIRSVNNESLKSLQILQSLIELGSERQTVQRHVDPIAPKTQNTGTLSPEKSPPEKSSSRELSPSSSVSRIGVPVPAAGIHEETNPSTVRPLPKENIRRNSATSRVLARNATTISNRGATRKTTRQLSRRRRPSSSSESRVKEPDPSFAVMVRSDGFSQNSRNSKPIFPPPFLSEKTARTESRKNAPSPIKEKVAVQPGRRRGRGSSAVVRAWTHMDAAGTLSRGRVHSDGSFTFMNCRPVEICDADNSKTQSGNERKVKRN